MHFKLSAAILAILPASLCAPSADMLNKPESNGLNVRAADPINVIPPGPSPDNPYFMVTEFDAFMPSPAYATNFSRAVFDITLMHPDLDRRWTTRCMAHTRGRLCDPDHWTACMPVAGEGNENEGLSFKFGDNLTSVDLMRVWKHGNMWLRTTASEPTTWVRKVDENDGGNVTVSELGDWYRKPEGWVFAWRETVG